MAAAKLTFSLFLQHKPPLFPLFDMLSFGLPLLATAFLILVLSFSCEVAAFASAVDGIASPRRSHPFIFGQAQHSTST
jgi:hypothetical protein